MFSPLHIIVYSTFGISVLLALTLLVLSLYAFVGAVQASAHAYTFANRRTKGFWVGVTGACAAYSLFATWGIFQGLRVDSLLLQLAAFVAAGVFLADVRPAVSPRR